MTAKPRRPFDGTKTHIQTVVKDKRYSISREFCGYAEARYVVRFCGDWIGQSKFKARAVKLAIAAKGRRNRELGF